MDSQGSDLLVPGLVLAHIEVGSSCAGGVETDFCPVILRKSRALKVSEDVLGGVASDPLACSPMVA